LTAGLVARAIVRQMPIWMQERFRVRAGIVLAAMHDIGKACPGFQKKCSEWLKRYQLDAKFCMGLEDDHAKVSQKVIQDILGGDSPLRFWAAIIGAHHGRLKGDAITAVGYRNDGGEAWERERKGLVEELCREFGRLPGEPPSADCPWDCGMLWFNAGLIAVADWMASDDATFPAGEALDSQGIVERVSRQMKTVVFSASGIAAPNKRFQDLFGFTPSALQEEFAKIAHVPGVYVLEGPMGCGKTEAALSAAYRLISDNQARGLYFALPTQVTSNRIHLRVASFLEGMLPDTKVRLTHGNSWLLDDKAAIMGRQSYHDMPKDEQLSGRDWFASSRRALLAPFGVGTIDQALLGVVAARHFFVRQFALAGKVVVLDEVHSYDVYTGALIKLLVRRLRDLGATIVVLSATLTAARRRDLLGLPDSVPVSSEYPLISALREQEERFVEVPVPQESTKSVGIEFPESDGLTGRVLAQAESGQCVLWICNTVASAQETFRQLLSGNRQGGVEIGLVHSRFPQFRREQLEERWMKVLGKDDANRPTHGCVLVSTQVAEQSVDIDADLLVTDIAPTDMLLQRIGRLWRHPRRRPDSAQRQAWVIAPPLDGGELRAVTATELKAAFGANAKVYAPYVLVRSLAEWRKISSIVIPSGIRRILEDTYAELSEEPESWRELRNELERRKSAMAAIALANSNPWQVQLSDEEGVQTRWNAMPTTMLLPVRHLWELPGHAMCDAIGLELLDGSRIEAHAGNWSFDVAKAIHRNLIRVPSWPVRGHADRNLGWLNEYVRGGVVACKLIGDKLSFLDDSESCLHYTDGLGLIIQREVMASRIAWQTHEEADDEFDE